jgi:hypothetical protein
MAALAVWQWEGYVPKCELAREAAANSAASVTNALAGCIGSDRWLGQFLSEQVQGVVDGFVSTH